jgi:hypothetical protein
VKKTLFCLLSLALLCGCTTVATGGFGSGVPMFETEAGAHRHCPGTPVVWVDTLTGVYHSKGDPWYGAAARHGAYACKIDADRASDLRHGYGLSD